MDTLKFFGAAILLLGFIFFILIRAIATNNYIRKSFYLLICGLVMTLFFVGGIMYDIILISSGLWCLDKLTTTS